MANIGVFPDAELVIASWIMSIPDIEIDWADNKLPWDLNVPDHYGYAQVTVIGGAPDQDAPMFHTVAQIDCWVLTPSDDRIYRLKASGLAKSIQYAAYDRINSKRGLTVQETLPDGEIITYPNAVMNSVYAMTEPHMLQSKDNPIYAGYSMDMTFNWTCGIQVN